MGKKVIFTQEQIQYIINEYTNNNKSSNQLAKEFNMGNKPILRILKTNNIDIKGSKKHYFNENIFDIIDTAEKAYWLGFITADGYIQYKNKKQGKFLRIKLQECDKNHLIKFINFIDGDEGMLYYEYHNTTGNKQYYVHVTSPYMIDALVNLGLEQGKSCNEKIIDVPEEFKKDYIRGLFDGDGHIEAHRMDLVNSNEVLNFVKDYFNNNCNTNIGKICDHCNTNRIFICKNREIALEHMYYPNCVCLERKKDFIKNNYKSINKKHEIAMLKSSKNGSDS